MRRPGLLLASGRDSDIFEYGDRLVLRRSRKGTSMTVEARVMEYVRENGFPVPAVENVSDDGTALIMERIDGPSMMTVMSRRPWTINQQGHMLAELHNRLHQLAGPEWIQEAPGGSGDRLIHLDLHPLNVILAPQGPIVIDWPNASRGDANVDVALTWLLLAAGGVPAGRIKATVMGWGRSYLIKSFLRDFDVTAARAKLPEVVEWKLSDSHMTDLERRAMRALAGG